MVLSDVRRSDRALLRMERYVDEGAKNYSPFSSRSETTPKYRPGSDEASFEIPTVIAPRDSVRIFEADPAKHVLEYYVDAKNVLFAVHPETWVSTGVEHLDELRALPRGEAVRVAPTASTRTVLAVDHSGNTPHHFLKLHYPRRISRFNRRLRHKNIHNSVAVSSDIGQIQFEPFAYLPDSLGFTFGDADTSWGFLVREVTPRPFQLPRPLVPCFALYAGDLKRPEDRPLLIQIIDRLGADPQSFVVDKIMIPVVQCWVRAARERGLLLESHAQNTLVELDEDFAPVRIVHRDLDVWIDFEARKSRGLELPFAGKGIAANESAEAKMHYSLVYDRFMCHEFFDYLLNALNLFYRIDEKTVRTRVKEAFHAAFPDSDRFFPANTMFYFSNDPPAGKEFELVDLNQPPEWR